MNVYEKSKFDILVVVLTLLVVIFGMYSDMNELNVVRYRFIAVPVGILFFLLRFYYYRTVNLSYIVTIFGVIAIMSIVGLMTAGNEIINEMSIPILALLVAYYFIAKLNIERNTFYIICFIIFIIIAAGIIDFYIGYITTSSRIFGDLFLGMSSRNAIGSWLVAVTAALTVVSRYEKGKTPLWPSLIGFILNIFLYRRMNIIASGIILIFVLLGGHKFKTIIVVALFLLIFNIFLDFNIFNYIRDNTHLVEGLKDNSRPTIWRSYFENIDADAILFGLQPGDVTYIRQHHNNNPYNSFIKLFGYFGIFPFLIIELWIIKRKNKRLDLLTAGCLLALIARGMTDIIFVGQTLDLFFFVVFLYFLHGNLNPKFPSKNKYISIE